MVRKWSAKPRNGTQIETYTPSLYILSAHENKSNNVKAWLESLSSPVLAWLGSEPWTDRPARLPAKRELGPEQGDRRLRHGMETDAPRVGGGAGEGARQPQRQKPDAEPLDAEECVPNWLVCE